MVHNRTKQRNKLCLKTSLKVVGWFTFDQVKFVLKAVLNETFLSIFLVFGSQKLFKKT